MTVPDHTVAVLDATVNLLRALAAADKAKAVLLASIVAADRALVGSPTLLADVRAFLADELMVLTASHERSDGTIGVEGEAMVARAETLVARLDAVLRA